MTSEGEQEEQETMKVQSSRFGELEVPADSVIEVPSGLIGFSKGQRFIMLEHKPPFSWLQSVDDPNLAFVIVDGFEFGEQYQVSAPVGDSDIDLREEDEYAILVIVTVRPDPRDTTANLKAPIFVNLRNKMGTQVIFDAPQYSTRFPLWAESEEGEGENGGEGEAPTE